MGSLIRRFFVREHPSDNERSQETVQSRVIPGSERLNPVHSGRFHRDGIDPTLLQPISQRMQVTCECTETTHWVVIVVTRDRNVDFFCANVQTGGVWAA